MRLEAPPVGVSGRYRLVVSSDKEMNDVIEDLTFDNLITDVGLNRIGTVNTENTVNSAQAAVTSFNSLCGRFVVGSGNTPPSVSDTALQNLVASQSVDSVDFVAGTSSYADGYYELVVSHQFGQGEAEGNLSEIGIQVSPPGGALWSRALILDGVGNPTTITVRDSDFLTCYYTLRINIPQQDSVYNIDVDYGEGLVVPTVVTIRPLVADNPTVAGGWGLQTVCVSGVNIASRVSAWTGGLAAPNATNPLGTAIDTTSSSDVRVTYEFGSFKRFITSKKGLGQFNSNNIQTVAVHSLMGAWQVNFNPPLEKGNTQTMDLTFGYSWARA